MTGRKGEGEGRPLVVVATRNAGKVRELLPMLAAAGFDATDLASLGVPETADEDGLETFDTFAGNALAKARHFARLVPGRPVLADDSGLAVDALGGMPGVRSKRWSGRADLSGRALDEANNRRLVAELAGVAERSARFVCAAAWVGPDGSGRKVELVALGEAPGRILDDARGAEGFGYDPYFLSDELGRSFGESSREEKARVSHRARAVAALLRKVAAGEGAVGGADQWGGEGRLGEAGRSRG